MIAIIKLTDGAIAGWILASDLDDARNQVLESATLPRPAVSEDVAAALLALRLEHGVCPGSGKYELPHGAWCIVRNEERWPVSAWPDVPVSKRPAEFVSAVRAWMASRETSSPAKQCTGWRRLTENFSASVMLSAMIDVLEGRIPAASCSTAPLPTGVVQDPHGRDG